MKIVIVDDEKPIRQWFSLCLEKSGNGFEIVGEAGNGREALQLCIETNPDVVITDITMPVMDGIELIKNLQDNHLTPEVVVLTCHADFENVRNAMKLGAFDYVLKAETEFSDVLEILERLRRKRDNDGAIRKAVKFHNQIERNTLMQDVIGNSTGSSGQFIEKLSALGVNLPENHVFAIAFCTLDSPSDLDLERTLSGIPADIVDRLYWFKLSAEKVMVLGNLSGAPSTLLQHEKLYRLLTYFYELFPGCLGASRIHRLLRDIKVVCQEALTAMNRSFFEGKICSYHMKQDSLDPTGLTSIHVRPDKCMSAIKKAVQEGDKTGALNSVQVLLALLTEGRSHEIEYIRRLGTQVLDSIGAVDGHTAVNQAVQFTQIRLVIETAVQEWMHPTEGHSEIKSHAVQKALDYIDEHYHEAITLTSVASQVHLNPNYFSQLFKEEFGENFSTYLTYVRMKKAEQLLRTKSLKTYEIAEKVGYPNLSYFSRKFKEHIGKSPFEYRNS